MRITYITVLLFVSSLISGCGKESTPETGGPQSRPVKTIVVSGEIGGAVRQFPGRIQANQTANLSFRVSGTLKEIDVKEGELVKAGQVLAKLDPTDYEIVVRDKRASFSTAKANFERAQSLMPDGYISRSDYDLLRSQLENARAALEKANQDLAYTQLLAPFDGVIAERLVDNFEEVQAKQSILNINNPDLLEVVVQLPESLIKQLGRRVPGQAGDVVVTARIENMDKEIPVKFKEVTARADPVTQTFGVTFTMPKLEDITVLPGMTATVTVDFSNRMKNRAGTSIWVPVDAVIAGKDNNARVFVVNESTMTVEMKDVKTGTVGSESIEIISGVSPGDRIVIAGAPYLTEGQPVTLMPDVEQASQ